jgi:hypothetical protein
MHDDFPPDDPSSDPPPQAAHVAGTKGSSTKPGTSATTIEAHAGHDDDVSSGTLASGGALSPAPEAHPPARSDFRAKDLIEELQTINSQIHRIMFQVERAVSRLSSNL